MTFSEPFLFICIVGSLFMSGVAAVVLLVLLLNDKRNDSIW